MSIKEKILELFVSTKELSIKEIGDNLLVSKQAIHYAINQLLAENRVEKIGRTPKTVYRILSISTHKVVEQLPQISEMETNFLKKNVLIITETGKMQDGLEGFDYWCKQRKLGSVLFNGE